MNRRDWFLIGLRLLGVYFAVVGVATLVSAGVQFMVLAREDTPGQFRGYGLLQLLQPLVYTIAGFYLTQLTEHAAGWLGEPGDAKKDEDA